MNRDARPVRASSYQAIQTTLILTASMVGKAASKTRRMAQFGSEINHSMAIVKVMVISGSVGQIKDHGNEVISRAVFGLMGGLGNE